MASKIIISKNQTLLTKRAAFIEKEEVNTIRLYPENKVGLGFHDYVKLRNHPGSFAIYTRWTPFSGERAYFHDEEDFYKAAYSAKFVFNLAYMNLRTENGIVIYPPIKEFITDDVKDHSPKISQFIEDCFALMEDEADTVERLDE